MTTLLVLTVGQSDVQLVIDGVRHELEPRMCGVLHDEIERRGYRLVDVPAKDRQRKDMLPEGDLTLCTPKLDAALRYLEGNSPPAAALIFDTRRTLRSDPRLAGAVLERRLNERGVQAARRHALLTDKDLLEDPSDPQDAVVRREVVQGVAQVLATEFADVKPDNVVVATTGGLAAANAVIEELVRLYAVGRASVQMLEVADGAFAAQDDRAVPERFHPATGFRARWQALSLIEGGNLLGAWGAVSHLADESSQEWTTVVDWLRYFASSLPIPEDCDINVLKHPRMAVRAALRVELGLRAGDVPRAIHGTVAFFEAALWDKLLEKASRHASKHQVVRFSAPPADCLVREQDPADLEKVPKAKQDQDRKRPFIFMELADGADWYRIDDSKICAIKIAKDYLKLDGLTKFGQGVEDVRALRNDVAHNEPTPELMDDARAQMRGAKLWSDEDTFLSQPLVQAVLHELGVQSPERLCEDLISTVRSCLLDHRLQR